MPSLTQHCVTLARGRARLIFRYLLVGSFLFMLDYAVTHALFVGLHQPLMFAQWTGRIVGAGAGYVLHRYYTFSSAGVSQRPAGLRYWFVAVGLWFISPILLSWALAIFPTSFLLAKVTTESLLVVASYLLLRHYVFHSSHNQ